jgi:hypothetical protein
MVVELQGVSKNVWMPMSTPNVSLGAGMIGGVALTAMISPPEVEPEEVLPLVLVLVELEEEEELDVEVDPPPVFE